VTTFTAWRWRCPTCARFLAADSVTSEVYRDPGAYYGVGDRDSATCGRCGPIEPQYLPTHWEDQ